jgi:hypothetical protein
LQLVSLAKKLPVAHLRVGKVHPKAAATNPEQQQKQQQQHVSKETQIYFRNLNQLFGTEHVYFKNSSQMLGTNN